MTRTLPTLLLVAVLGCGTQTLQGDADSDAVDAADSVDATDSVDEAPDTVDAAWDPTSDIACQPPRDIQAYLSTDPILDEGYFSETGTVESIDLSDPECARFTIRYPDITGFPTEQTYRVPISPTDLLDLDEGDELDVTFMRGLMGDYIQTTMHISRDGQTVLSYMDCLHLCSSVYMETSPLSLETLSGACMPEEDSMGCAMRERRGYRATCPSSPDPVDVFDHNSATIACDAEYLVIVEDHSTITERLDPTCFDIIDDKIEVVILRLR